VGLIQISGEIRELFSMFSGRYNAARRLVTDCWVGLAAVRAKGLAFIINISCAGVPVWETTLDQARNEIVTTDWSGEHRRADW
jgi:hypothetical protein